MAISGSFDGKFVAIIRRSAVAKDCGTKNTSADAFQSSNSVPYAKGSHIPLARISVLKSSVQFGLAPRISSFRFRNRSRSLLLRNLSALPIGCNFRRRPVPKPKRPCSCQLKPAASAGIGLLKKDQTLKVENKTNGSTRDGTKTSCRKYCPEHGLVCNRPAH